MIPAVCSLQTSRAGDVNVNRRAFLVMTSALLALGSVEVAHAQDAAAKRELAPTGKLRVAIAVSPAPSALYVVADGASGKYRGVAVDLGTQIAAKLNVPVEFVAYKGSGDITNDADKNVWDVTFMPVDDERKKRVAFGSPYHVLQSTYAVAPGAKIESVAAANSPAVRIGGVAGTTTFRASSAVTKNAQHITVASVDEAVELMKAGKIDAIALSRETLGGLVSAVPGLKVLDGGFWNSTTAIAVPKDKPAALAYASVFIEEAKASGAVRAAFDRAGLTASVIAPAGMKP